MPVCKRCNEYFPSKVKIEGKVRDCGHRIFCLKCNPFGERSLRVKNINKDILLSRDESGKKSYIGICNICKEEKMLKGRNLACSACRAKIQRNEKKKALLNELNTKCYICGYNKSFCSIDFHHINPDEKEMEISGMWHMPIERIRLELQKCVPLCRNCHAELHYGLFELLLRDLEGK